MKRRLFFTVLCLILVFALRLPAFAVDAEEPAPQATPTVDESELTETLVEQENPEESLPTGNTTAEPPAQAEPVSAGPDILVNGSSIRAQATARVYGQTTYLSVRAVVSAMLPEAQVSWTDGGAYVQAQGLTLFAKPGSRYLIANGRYLYIPEGILLDGGATLVPARVLAKALGAGVSWDAATGNIVMTSVSGPIQTGESYYASDAVYWLSHIINAESGAQPLEGKIAVGTVILNRVSSPLFPDTIYDVIFERRGGNYQFSPVRSGAVHREPNAESVIAAKLCLDGAREAGGSLFFNAVGQSCWASRNRTLVTTIGGHNFYN